MRTKPSTRSNDSVKRIWLPIVLACLAVSLSGCEIVEYLWLVPRADREVSIGAQTNAEVLDAFEAAAASFINKSLEPVVTYRDVDQGIIELGPYRGPSAVGYATRASIDRRKSLVKFVVKGTGPYYTDLPVDEVAEKIAVELSNRLRS